MYLNLLLLCQNIKLLIMPLSYQMSNTYLHVQNHTLSSYPLSAPSFLSLVNDKFSYSSEHKATNHICMHLFVNTNFSLVNLSLDSEVISSLYIKLYFFIIYQWLFLLPRVFTRIGHGSLQYKSYNFCNLCW